MIIDRLEPGAPPGLNVLVIAYYFPPMGLSGVQRTLKFVKYLPEYGWRPIVLTAGETPYYAMDQSLLDELAPLIERNYVRIVRTKEGGAPGAFFRSLRGGAKEGAKGSGSADGKILKLPSAGYQRLRSKIIQTFYQPDSRIGWRKPALALAEKIIKEERVDAILSTAPPYTDFLIGRELRERHNIPLLLDYRDAWVSNPVLNFYATPLHKAYARKQEDECLRASGAITVVNRRMKEVLLAHHNFLTHEDIAIVPHGYDSEDIEKALAIADEYTDPSKFRLTYTGAFYVGRSPAPIFDAVKLAMMKEPGLKQDLELVFVGILQKEFQKLAQKSGLAQNIVAKGYLPHLESVAMCLASDVLWMTMSDDISAPGKLYEYLGTGRTILGLVPPGSQAEKLIMEYGAGVTVPPKNVKAIAEAVLQLYRSWLQSRHTGRRSEPEVNIPFVNAYDRKTLTKEMARQLGLMLGP